MNQDAKDQPRIRQVLFTLDKNRNYKFDVNQTITLKNLKKMIIAAANLGKVNLQIFHKGTDYTHIEDSSSLLDLFPEQQLVEFTISVAYSNEADLEENIQLTLGKYCLKHNFKYPYFYCYDCKASICSTCRQEEHSSHNLIEKYDYLQSSRNLVETIFHGMKDTFQGLNLEGLDALRQRIRHEIRKFHDTLQKVEDQLLDLIKFFEDTEKTSFSNMQQNVSLLKNHCAEGLDRLKNEISIEDMMVDEEIFILFDKKFKEIASEKIRVAHDTKKFDELKKIPTSLVQVAEKILNDISCVLDGHLLSGVFKETKLKIFANSVSAVSKDDIINKMLSDVKRKSYYSTSKLLDTPGRFPSVPGTGVSKSLSFPSPAKDNQRDQEMMPEALMENPIAHKSQAVNNLQQVENSIMDPEKPDIFICCPVELTQEMLIYDHQSPTVVQKKKLGPFSAFFEIENFLKKASFLNAGGKTYISGGILPSGQPSTSFISYDHKTCTLLKLPNMTMPRHSHSMICYNGCIYFVGGNTPVVEKFNIEEQKFTKLASLQVEERNLPLLYVYKNYLYAFFGYTNKGNYLETIERLNLKNAKARWEYAVFKGNGINLKMSESGIIPIGDSQIYIFGGQSNTGLRNSAVKFDFSGNTFEAIEYRLDMGVKFGESIMADLGNNEFGNFNRSREEDFFKITIG